ncbi:prepilin-type N-terminal cleavage/methylation domain-containing protein [bacterium]|jgi:prepilin-type N-terminal cleavage/methylation domain-containing protein|nr:prepilin-type N-terminal cleavage/methylation domain-containing protein [bacterium]
MRIKKNNIIFSHTKGKYLKGRRGAVSAFTLIELMISILIIVLLVIVSYAPYNYYQKKANLKITAKSISQVLQDSKTKAIS